MVSFSLPPRPLYGNYWERYDHDAVPLPTVGFEPPELRDPYSRRLYENYDRGEYRITETHIRNARHAYYAMISYLDDKIGALLATIEAAGFAEDTIVVLTSDHGYMLGEKGLWYKMSFFEDAARVPLIIHAPNRFAPRRVSENVFLVDLLPIFIDLADGNRGEGEGDGRSLMSLMAGIREGWSDTVFGEYTATPAMYCRTDRRLNCLPSEYGRYHDPALYPAHNIPLRET